MERRQRSQTTTAEAADNNRGRDGAFEEERTRYLLMLLLLLHEGRRRRVQAPRHSLEYATTRTERSLMRTSPSRGSCARMGTRVGQSCISQPNNPLVTYIINVTLSICAEVTRWVQEWPYACHERAGMVAAIEVGRTGTGTMMMSFSATA